MTMEDCTMLMNRADQLKVPYLTWTFHMRCSPNLLIDNSENKNGCGIGMPLQPTEWGHLLKTRLLRHKRKDPSPIHFILQE